MTLDLAVIVPTFNERDNLAILRDKLSSALDGIAWEMIVVDDDSPDGTSDAARELAQSDPRVRCLQRIDRRGLGSACIEGMLASSAPALAVIDGDLQHDETILPRMLKRLHDENADVVIATRYAQGGSTGEWSRTRTAMSRVATRIAERIIGCHTSDPMSGFFLLRRSFLDSTVRHLSGKGFKILLDMLASSPTPPVIAEEPYTFRERQFGESKLDMRVLRDFFILLCDKTIGRLIPVRFLMFCTVGALGVLVHLLVLGALFQGGQIPFWSAQAGAALVAMIANFYINNIFTYNDRRLRGIRFFSGLLGFILACSIGAVVNVAIAHTLYQHETPWLLAGFVGIVISSVWNYSITRNFIWARAKK